MHRAHSSGSPYEISDLRIFRPTESELPTSPSLRDRKDPEKVLVQLGRLKERYRKAWGYVKISFQDLRMSWRWNRHALRMAASRDGAYLLPQKIERWSNKAVTRSKTQCCRSKLQNRRLGEIDSARNQFLFQPLYALISIRPLMPHHLHVHRYG